MVLDQLSDELILEIAEHLSSKYGNKSLGSIALCSRRLNNIISPLLYRTFTQGWKPAVLPILLRTVMEKPIIGAEIKHLILTEIIQDDDGGLDMSGYSPQNFERCQTAIRSFELSINKLGWMTELEQGSWDAVVSLLLFFLPSLEGIEIESDGLSQCKYLHQIIQHMTFNQRIKSPVGKAHSLKHLQRFSIDYWDTEWGMGVQVILPYCAIPSIETVRASMLEDEVNWANHLPTESYLVRNLRIHNSSVHGLTIRNLLTCFVALQRLYYDHGSATVGMADFLPQRIGEGIAHLHDSLEELTLFGTEYDEISGEEARGSLGSLAEFKKLRCIGTEAEVLFSRLDFASAKPKLINILPASLETLVIRLCDDDIYSQLREFVRHGKDKFPVLKTVAIDIPSAREGGLNGIGPDGLHEREEEVKKYLEELASHPEIRHVNTSIYNLRNELESIQLNKPTEAEWRSWRARQLIEQELIAAYKDAGIELRFNLFSGHEWAFMPPFMVY
ncbi:hypothetical protein N431DRAFT_159357 [Stipitochalara longipes BDJ]|nr:hypothetical protein N431DRAFT_159357 [Stipitochalara longipes BDJ]